MKDNRPHKFKLLQDGFVVVAVESRDREQALREINHYATMYGQDGPVTIKEVTRKKSKE